MILILNRTKLPDFPWRSDEQTKKGIKSSKTSMLCSLCMCVCVLCICCCYPQEFQSHFFHWYGSCCCCCCCIYVLNAKNVWFEFCRTDSPRMLNGSCPNEQIIILDLESLLKWKYYYMQYMPAISIAHIPQAYIHCISYRSCYYYYYYGYIDATKVVHSSARWSCSCSLYVPSVLYFGAYAIQLSCFWCLLDMLLALRLTLANWVRSFGDGLWC